MQSHFNPLPPHGGRPPEENPTPCNNDYFNPLPPHGGRPIREKKEVRQQTISIHSLRMEGDRITLKVDCQESISIHSLRMEGDNTPYIFSKASFAFQSTPSAWRETYAFAIKPHAYDVFQSTPSAWRETPVEHYFSIRNSFQSTPSAWRETRAFDDSIIAQYISIHSLRMEGD